MLVVCITFLALGLGLIIGFLAGLSPYILLSVPCVIASSFLLLRHFEYSVIALLILRSAIDSFTEQQLTALFAVSLDCLAILAVSVRLFTRQRIYIDRMWLFFAIWLAVQSLWVVLLPLGGLGMGGWLLSDALREWIRLFSWLMAYLLVMQLQEKLAPQKIINLLFLALLAPLSVALVQIIFPSILPPVLSINGVAIASAAIETEVRIRGTIGHPNGLATLLFFFLGLAYWKSRTALKYRFSWLVVLAILAGFYVTAKSLFSLVMLAVFITVIVARRFSLVSMFVGLAFLLLVILLFGSSDFGQARLASISATPLFNPDLDINRAILMSNWDYNSFNWRLSQWYLLIQRWKEYPWLGYGLGLSLQTAGNGFLPHNDFIRAIIEGGVVGLTTYLALFIAQMLHLFRLFQKTTGEQKQLCFILFAMVPAIMMGMVTENIWSHTMLYFYWWTVVAVAGWDWNSSLHSSAESPDFDLSVATEQLENIYPNHSE